MKGSIDVRVTIDDEESGSESEYDFVNTPPSSPQAVPQSDSPLVTKGWSTLDLSEAVAEASSAEASVASATGADTPTATSEKRGGPLFNCVACGFLLRDCVECPRCHSLFCRSHLRIDENGESPCPCEPCVTSSTGNRNKSGSVRANNKLATDSFLPNIPVQRMADAVPSSCEGCGISLTWVELAFHMCDLQIVSCEDARWGCTWAGKRINRPEHMASSTCAGRIARVEDELAKARTELSKARSEIVIEREAREAAVRRASAAEVHNKELKLMVTKHFREKEAAVAAAAQATAALTKATAKVSGVGGKSGAGSSRNTGDSSGGGSAGPTAAVGSGGQVVPSGGQMQGSGQENAVTAAFPGMFKLPGRLQQEQQQQQHRQAGVVPPSSVGNSRERSAGHRGSSGSGGATEAASQATIPPTEACLRPYLERPDSLLEKKVVVFWPRQGRWYVGRPTAYKPGTKEHRIEYDDGDVRDHVLAHRAWGLIG